MSDLVEMLLELIIDGAGVLAEKASSKAKGHWLSVILAVVMLCALLVYFAFGTYAGWQAGDAGRMWTNIASLVLLAALLAFIGLRRLIRWRKNRDKTMYDPRYQK